MSSENTETDIVQLDVQYEKELKTSTKHFKYNKKKPLQDQFNDICALFQVPEDKIETFSLQFGKAGAYYTPAMGTIPDELFKGPVSEKFLFAQTHYAHTRKLK